MFLKSKIGLSLLAFVSTSCLANNVKVSFDDQQPADGVVVYLVPQFELPTKIINSQPASILQKDKKFAPYLTVVQTGTQPQFVNEDDITHHIYSAIGPKRFSFKLKSQSTNSAVKFNAAGHVAMGCNIHDWMSGHVLVVDTPFYGITGAQGKITFDKAPAGNYQLVVWHPQMQADNNQQIFAIDLKPQSHIPITISAKIDPLPEQVSLDDFEFLEGY